MTDQFELNMDEYLPLREVVFKTLRKAILTGELKPGERLMEIHLAKKIGVSRTPIREAIHKLEQEGLVTMMPRRGAIVAEISEKGLRDVLEVRRALDTFCAELACERISEEEKEALRAACIDFEEAVKTGDATVIAKADVAFHDIIIGATGNERMVMMINNLAEQMYRYRFEYIKDVSNRERLIKEHRVLMDAILKENVIGARDAAREHIDNQEKSILMQIHLED
ncbi:MAG: GntR family transcriptional regulator [Lachnospiraceae bacterium]|nr:GntR family transcriptional regulator [Lachnospiraceae bacterium]